MTTKEQERKALEQIKKIVAGLGERSYVGTAFAGCFETAEENIEYDAAFSLLGRAESAEKKELEAREKLIAVAEKNERLQREIDNVREAYDLVVKRETEEVRARDEWNRAYNDAQARVNELEETVLDQAREIMKLKAKLFDLLFTEPSAK